MTIDEVNAMSPGEFRSAFGHLYEHSPWVVEEAAGERPLADFHAMLAALNAVVDTASEGKQLALLRAHPELAGKAAIDRTLTGASTEEQASAGLDRMTPEEYETFHARNAAYRKRFDFPFIICVRLTNKPGILSAMESRLRNSREQEFRTALDEVSKIVRLRLEAMLP